MIKSISILLFVFYSMSSFAHDIKLAVFEVNFAADHKISLVVKFDKNDILKELYTTCKDKSEVNNCIEQYINEHFKLTFDTNSVCFKMLEVDRSKEYITLNLISDSSVVDFKEISVFNNSLIAKNQSQENIVKFLFHNKNRSFRMNKNRMTTVVKY